MTVKGQRISGAAWVGVLPEPEDPLAFTMQQAGVGQCIDRPAGSELGIKAQPGLWPQQPRSQSLRDRVPDALVANMQKPLNEPLVVTDDRIAQPEDIHESPRHGGRVQDPDQGRQSQMH